MQRVHNKTVMNNRKEMPEEKKSMDRFWQFIKKNGVSTLMAVVLVILLISPDAKSWALRQLVQTGLFNASIKETTTVDQPSVDFDFDDGKGNVRNTASLRGKVVFVNFWASWCPPCRTEFPSIETLYSKFKDNPNVFFLMVNEDGDIEAGLGYLEKENFSVPFYRRSGTVPGEIYSGALPTTVVLDKSGKVRFHHTAFANYSSDKFVRQVEELINE